jgi:FkbM family methyltransferase
MQRLADLKTEVLPFNGLELHMTKQDFWSSKLRLQNDNWLFRKWWPVWQELGLHGAGHLLDVGANYGVASWEFLSQGFVTSTEMFEPIQENCESITRTYHATEVAWKLHNTAVGETSGVVEFAWNKTQTGTSHVVQQGQGNRQVPIVNLDSLTLDPVKLMKIDVEGHELAVLQGATQLLERDQPWIFFECNHKTPDELARSHEAIQWLTEHGYTCISASQHVISHKQHVQISNLASDVILSRVNDLLAVPTWRAHNHNFRNINLNQIWQQQLDRMSGTITWQDNVPWAPAPAAKVPDLLPYVQDGQRYQPSKSNRVYQLLDNQVLVTEKFFLEFPRPQTVTSSLFF